MSHKINQTPASKTPLSLLWEPRDSRKATGLCEEWSYLGLRLGAICTVFEGSYKALTFLTIDKVEWNLVMHIFREHKINSICSGDRQGEQ